MSKEIYIIAYNQKSKPCIPGTRITIARKELSYLLRKNKATREVNHIGKLYKIENSFGSFLAYVGWYQA